VSHLQKRLLQLIPVFIVVTFTSYFMLDLLPGDITDAILSDQDAGTIADGAAKEALARELNLDKPVVVRYVLWLGDLFQGDLGRSYVTTQPVAEALADRIPVSLQLMFMSQILALLIAVPLGVFVGQRAGQPVDRFVSAGAFALLSVPIFVIGTALIWLFSIELGVLPSSGHTDFADDPWRNIKGFILPSITIAAIEVPILMRVLRTDIITTLQEDFIALAKAKGLSNTRILFFHALRPSLFTFITVLGLQLGNLIAGSVVVESLFSIPGVGKLLIESVDSRDEIMVQGVVTFIAIVYVVANLMVDLLYTVIDPRVSARRA